MRLESILVFVSVIGTIRLLYQFRHLPLLQDFLPIAVALLLLYVPWFHNRIRRLRLRFFESDGRGLIRSLQLFLFVAALLLPPFLLGNHWYQRHFFSRVFAFQLPPDLPSLALTQLLLISLPEEFFYRGWLQPLVARRLGGTRAILLASLLFALSHSFIALQWWHFAIFFPSCVFGWLREKTGTLTASVLFHTLSNLLVAWIGACYR